MRQNLKLNYLPTIGTFLIVVIICIYLEQKTQVQIRKSAGFHPRCDVLKEFINVQKK